MFEKIKEDLKKAQLDRNGLKVSTLRLLVSEITNAKISKGEELSDSDIISVVQREVKKRKEAAEGFRKGDREELVQKEESESKILESYLPEQISDAELTGIVEDVINSIGASSMQDMGKVIGMVMGRVGQSADGGRVSAIVKQKLSNG